MNRNFGKLDETNKLTYAPDWLRIGDTEYLRPTDEQYAACGWLAVHDEKPTDKVGVYYIPDGWEVRDGAIWRTYHEEPITPPPTVYIVEEIIYQLIEAQKLQATKQVVGDYWELLTMRERIDATNPYWAEAFPQVCAGLIAAGVFESQDEIDALLAKCREGYVDEESGREVTA